MVTKACCSNVQPSFGRRSCAGLGTKHDCIIHLSSLVTSCRKKGTMLGVNAHVTSSGVLWPGNKSLVRHIRPVEDLPQAGITHHEIVRPTVVPAYSVPDHIKISKCSMGPPFPWNIQIAPQGRSCSVPASLLSYRFVTCASCDPYFGGCACRCCGRL